MEQQLPALIMSGDRTEGQILARVYAEPQPPGGGLFVRQGEQLHLVQVVHFRSLRSAG